MHIYCACAWTAGWVWVTGCAWASNPSLASPSCCIPALQLRDYGPSDALGSYEMLYNIPRSCKVTTLTGGYTGSRRPLPCASALCLCLVPLPYAPPHLFASASSSLATTSLTESRFRAMPPTAGVLWAIPQRVFDMKIKIPVMHRLP